MDTVRRHPVAIGIAAVLLLFVLLASFPIVPETKYPPFLFVTEKSPRECDASDTSMCL